MKNKSRNKHNMGSVTPDKERQPARYEDKDWQNPQYGEKKDSKRDKVSGCGDID